IVEIDNSGQVLDVNLPWGVTERCVASLPTGHASNRRYEMSRRLLQLIGLAAVIMVVVALLTLAPIAGQAPTARATAGDAEKAGPAGKTPWGEPDLQGIWTNHYEIPVERPARYANKEFFTEEERAELDRQRAGLLSGSRRSE